MTVRRRMVASRFGSNGVAFGDIPAVAAADGRAGFDPAAIGRGTICRGRRIV
jgi:hypothetical protein